MVYIVAGVYPRLDLTMVSSGRDSLALLPFGLSV